MVAQFASDRQPFEHCDRLDMKDAAATAILVRGAAGRFAETVLVVLNHLLVHQIHHRGQVHAILDGTSAKPPQLDEFFLNQNLPVRIEELRALALT